MRLQIEVSLKDGSVMIYSGKDPATTHFTSTLSTTWREETSSGDGAAASSSLVAPSSKSPTVAALLLANNRSGTEQKSLPFQLAMIETDTLSESSKGVKVEGLESGCLWDLVTD
jgi:hypothetical protein